MSNQYLKDEDRKCIIQLIKMAEVVYFEMIPVGPIRVTKKYADHLIRNANDDVIEQLETEFTERHTLLISDKFKFERSYDDGKKSKLRGKG